MLNSKSFGASKTITIVEPRLNSPIHSPFFTSTPDDDEAFDDVEDVEEVVVYERSWYEPSL